jgi:endogenous inhibitor of DNA gyrase (YacG/DUF329 family)
MAINDNERATLGPCPICGKPGLTKYRPFCSQRCSDVDLQRWFTGRYAIPAVEDEDTPDAPPDDAGQPRGG